MDELIALLVARDDRATAAVERAGPALASAVGTLSSLADVELVMIGGAIARLTPWLSPVVETLLADRSAAVPGFRPQLGTATFGREAPRVAAWRLARQEVIDDPARIPALAPS